MVSMLKDLLKERLTSPESHNGDFLDQISKDMEKEKFLSEDFIVQLIFGGLFATFESVSAVMALAFSLLSEHPSVVEEMIVSRQSLSISLFYIMYSLSSYLCDLRWLLYIRLSRKQFSKTEKIQTLHSHGKNISR